MAGGLGGFLLPIMFGILLDLIGVPSSCFMLLYGIVWVSLILSYLTEVRRLPGHRGRGGRLRWNRRQTDRRAWPGRFGPASRTCPRPISRW